MPERQDVIWIDGKPQACREIRDLHPVPVLSPRTFNAGTDLILALPMTAAACNATSLFALAVGLVGGAAGGGKAGKVSHLLCHQPRSFRMACQTAP
jgi:mRNA-degrading endonuclease toxin of MazEF toxin-antitoxin module